ncbi:MAG: chromosomal replication initiator protein DnaA, partial [Candidatus Marinimicrobia bacterium]|nr:chromosomal replication initiator protein DnaA [Candidatus Neomarinimicrobiota bacterium]
STVESMLIPPKNTSVNDDIRLNERYVFDTFVEGPHNRFAKVASKAVGESPGNTSFNPLLIYGGSGLGKTHLLQAIGSHVRQKFPGKNIIYVSSEKFMQDYISALQNNRSRDFTSKYRSCDLLLVDDIQFLESKTGTQEQFFHTFNELYQAGKQIVITADRTPKEMKGVEERLISRFISGLMVDIQPPDLETRIAILKKKALNEDLEIPDEVLSFVANNIKNNVRELESAIIKIFAYSSLTNMDIDITLAKRVIKDILGIKQSSKISIEHILKSVSKTYHISENEIIGKGRQKITAMARQIVMYFARELSGDSLKSIGLRLGGRDHSTVIHACNTIVEKMKKDEDFKSELDTLRNQIELNSLE